VPQHGEGGKTDGAGGLVLHTPLRSDAPTKLKKNCVRGGRKGNPNVVLFVGSASKKLPAEGKGKTGGEKRSRLPDLVRGACAAGTIVGVCPLQGSKGVAWPSRVIEPTRQKSKMPICRGTYSQSGQEKSVNTPFIKNLKVKIIAYPERFE